MAPKVCFLGAVRRRTMICCRNVKFSASSAARDRNRSTTAQTMSLKRSLITEQHRPILGQPPVNRFATGTGELAREPDVQVTLPRSLRMHLLVRDHFCIAFPADHPAAKRTASIPPIRIRGITMTAFE